MCVHRCVVREVQPVVFGQYLELRRPAPSSRLLWLSPLGEPLYAGLFPRVQDQASALLCCWSLVTVAHHTKTNQVLTCLLPQGTWELRCLCQALPTGLTGCNSQGEKEAGMCVPATVPLQIPELGPSD